MRILVVADEPNKALWDYYDGQKLKGLDLILSAGDLPPEYLSFLVTFANCPLYYVHGNHDTKYEHKPPEGCRCIDDKVVKFEGLRILGLGGSMQYNGREFQFTEQEMAQRVRKQRFNFWRYRGVDIVLTHAPALGINDQEDMCHRGFASFLYLLDNYRPKYMVHGHVHMNYGHQIPRETKYKDTLIINAYSSYILDTETGKHEKI